MKAVVAQGEQRASCAAAKSQRGVAGLTGRIQDEPTVITVVAVIAIVETGASVEVHVVASQEQFVDSKRYNARRRACPDLGDILRSELRPEM